MSRAVFIAAASLSIAALAAKFANPAMYELASSLCMRLADGFAHPDVLVVALFSSVATIALVATGSAVRQAIRTRSAVALLRRSERGAPPRLSRIATALGVRGRLDVVESDELLAFCYGLRSPRLLISSALINCLEDDELEAVLRHEIVHAQRHDPLRTLVARSLGAGFSFIPMSTGFLQAYLCRRELTADRSAVSQMGDPVPLASALQQTLLHRGMTDMSSLAVGGLSATDIRIDNLLGIDTSPAALVSRPSTTQIAFFALLLVLAVCALLASAHAASGVRPCVPC